MAVTALDTLANALCIAMMLRILGRRRKPLRILAAALMGALGAHGLRLLALSRGISALLWLPLAAGISAAVVGRFSLRSAGLLLSCEGFLGGTIYALSGALASKEAAWCIGAVYALILSANAAYTRKAAAHMHTVRIRITHGQHVTELEALVDSGNCLRDYLTHRPVIVLPEAAREKLGLCGVPLRPIFADTAGGRTMMDCFTPRSVWVLEDGRATAVSACAAFSPGLPAEAPALVPQSLLVENKDESRADREGKAHGEAEG